MALLLDQVPMHHIEILQDMQDLVAEHLNLLADSDELWQPSDYLPDLSAEDWREQLEAFREQAREISDELLVVLVGDMVTEEALPSYAVSLNLIACDFEGDSIRPWSKWLRGWTAEENRHGDLLGAYLRLTGRVNMRSIEVTIHRLLADGFNPRAFPDPYNGLIYTSFQEQATRISDQRIAEVATAQGETHLSMICKKIAGDEARHEKFYQRMVEGLMDVDPEGAILAFREMMRGQIVMPGRNMNDGQDPNLFHHFSIIAQRLNIYTPHDYAGIIGHLVKTWKLADRSVSGKAAKAQDYLCRQADRYENLADEFDARLKKQPPMKFSWIHDRCA
jgi:acyl-[acyl-carrier-protein] desaturase